jgi:hypothetical protein
MCSAFVPNCSEVAKRATEKAAAMSELGEFYKVFAEQLKSG